MDACILWDKYKNDDGYGIQWHAGRLVKAHRLSYCVANGLSISDIEGKVVRHKCDTPACVNPNHLELGSHADNMKDMAERGRAYSAKGTDHPMHKLTENDVRRIREVYVPRHKEYGAVALATQYGVNHSLICAIASRKVWKHVT